MVQQHPKRMSHLFKSIQLNMVYWDTKRPYLVQGMSLWLCCDVKSYYADVKRLFQSIYCLYCHFDWAVDMGADEVFTVMRGKELVLVPPLCMWSCDQESSCVWQRVRLGRWRKNSSQLFSPPVAGEKEAISELCALCPCHWAWTVEFQKQIKFLHWKI